MDHKTTKHLCMTLIAASALCLAPMSPAWAWHGLATEWTQLLNKAQLIKQLAEQVRMVQNQIQMLKTLGAGVKGELTGFNGSIADVFGQTQNVLNRADSLTWATNDLMHEFDKRYYDPASPEGRQYTDVEAAADHRARQWKASQQAYMESLGVTAASAKNEEEQRLEMLRQMQATGGQLQALQVLGHMLTETNQLLARQHQDMAALIDLTSSRERDRIDQELAAEQLR